jgi:mono/diheme cytochrome c family protein
LASRQTAPGNRAAGKAFFSAKGKCSACHSDSNFSPAAKENSKALAQTLLRPPKATGAGMAAHRKQLELYTPVEFENVVSYLASLK